jgi:hypothetical protein
MGLHVDWPSYFRHAVNRSEFLLHELPSILNKKLLRIGNPDFAFRDRVKAQEKRHKAIEIAFSF